MDYFLLYGAKGYISELPTFQSAKWFTCEEGELLNLSNSLKKDTKLSFRGFQGVLLEKMPSDADLDVLFELADAYTIIADLKLKNVQMSEKQAWFFKAKMVTFRNFESPGSALDWLVRRLFGGQAGSKITIAAAEVNSQFRGRVSYNGFKNVRLSGNFGDEFWPVISWRWGVYCDEGKNIELWPQYYKSAGVELRLAVYENLSGGSDYVRRRMVFTEKDMEKPLLVEGTASGSILNMCLEVRGEGNLTFGDITYRWSRREMGSYIAGGEDITDSNRELLCTYFNPGDMKPPLNVYFSGYRTAGGFEGFYMMRSMKTPFMLVADPRLEGGEFYMGSEELEQKLADKIQEKLSWLGFDNSQLVFSGLSMGTFGALYYASKLLPHVIVLGKPIASVGKVALKETDYRYGIFGTSLDVLDAHSPSDWHAPYKDRAEALDKKFWDSFDNAEFDNTIMAIAYMEDDDYDPTAYQDLLKNFAKRKKNNRIIAKGFPGHHNDATQPLVKWFRTQYNTILRDEYGR